MADSEPLSKRMKQNKTISSCQQYPLATMLLAAIMLASTLLQASTDEEEIVERDVQFSVPADLADLQRKTSDLKGYSFLAGASAYTGNDNNVHRSPEIVSISSSTLGTWFYVRSDKRFGKNVQLINSLTWKHRSYSSASAANLSRLYLSNWLDMRLSSHFKLALDFDVIGENDNATQITGTAYTRDYSYRRYSGDAMLTWNPGGPHRFQIGGELVRRDYGEIPGYNSIDWTSRGGTARYRFRLAPYHYLKLWYTVGEKEYSDEPSSSANTEVDAPNSPMERHRYRELRMAWEVPATQWMDASIEYFHRSKTDLFQGAESWDGDVWQGWLGIEVSPQLELTAEVGYFTQKFDQLLGNDNLPLETKRWDVQAGARFALTRSIRLFASTNRFERTSNRDSGSVYLDYRGWSTAFGISFFVLTR